MAMKIRNLTSEDVELNDLNGITVPANSDILFDPGIDAAMPYSIDFITAVNNNSLVLVNNEDIELSKDESLGVVNSGYDDTALIASINTKQDDLGLGTAGQILATNVTADDLEWINLASELTEVNNESPTLQTGAHTIQLINPATSESLRVYKNGLRQSTIIDYTYNEVAKLISFNTNFLSTDTVVLDYKY